jgi:outer membrane autotransporter protein
LSSSIGQFNAYLGSGLGPFDLDFLGGLGVAKLSSRRFVDFGTTFKAQADANWWAGEGHAAIRASLPMQMSNWLELRPYTAFTYVALDEQGYKEGGGGTAIDLSVDGTFSQRLWGDVGLEFAGHFGRPGLTQISPRLTLGWRANLIDEAASRTLRFNSGGSDFTLTDNTDGEGGAIVGLGVEASNGFSTFSLSYEGQFSNQIQRNSLNAALRFRF